MKTGLLDNWTDGLLGSLLAEARQSINPIIHSSAFDPRLKIL
jgi:hypothetical protein